MVWPEPPHRARIRLVNAIRRPEDIGIQRSFWRRIGDVIAGTSETGFVRPTGIAATARAMYIADPGVPALWILALASGRLHRVRDTGAGPLVSPVAVAPGPGDAVWVADSYLARVFLYRADGKVIARLGEAQLARPAGLAYDGRRDRLYVADSLLHQVVVFAGDGRRLGTIGRRGTGEGEFNFPTHVSVDREGALYVTDAMSFRVQMFDADGRFSGAFGRHGDSSGELASPKGVAVDSEGHIYVVDALFDAVQIFDRRGRYLLTFGERGIGPGQFWLPGGVFIDSGDRIYVADAYNQRIQTFQYLAGGGDD
jgi:hypothetical protein